MPFDYPVAGAPAPATGSGTQEEPMALKPYKTTVYGYETTLLLSDEDAKAQGLLKDAPAKAEPAKKAATPANKARKSTANKAK
jgi:hypothetical protein